MNPRSASDPMRPWIVNMSTGVFIPCVSSYEKPVMKIMSVEASRNAKVCFHFLSHVGIRREDERREVGDGD